MPLNATVVGIGEAMEVAQQLDAISQTLRVEGLDIAHVPVGECEEARSTDARTCQKMEVLMACH